jgi:gliding motility-associated-like protein
MRFKIINLVFIVTLLYFTDAKAQAPAISSFSPKSGAPGTLITIQGSALDQVNSVSIGGKAALIISLSATVLTAYVMPESTSGPVSISSSSATAGSSDNFTVNTTPFPSTQQGNKLVGTGNNGLTEAGRSVAISADGNTAIVGAPNDNTQQGAAWIYVRNGNVWSQQGSKLVGSGSVGRAQQGRSVAISADGNTVISGGYLDNGGRGAAWIFTRKGSVWTQQGSKLVGTGYDDFILPVNMGFSVGMSADGNTIIMGGPYDTHPRGAAWIFSRKNEIWSQQGEKLFDEGSPTGGQGISVGISADGNTAIVGAPLDNNQQGAAFLYFRTGSVWDRQAKKLDVSSYPGTKWQGISVALSANGSNAIIGASVADNARGAAWVFQKNGAEWNLKGNKIAGTVSSDNAAQGSSVGMSADGNTVLLGARLDNWTNGAAWVFTWTDNSWTQRGPKLTGTGNIGIANQGLSSALSADGSTAIVGGNQDNTGMGAAWIFTPGPQISISLKNYSSEFCKGVIKTVFFYDKTEGNPNLYSITWDQKGLDAGLLNVVDQPLTAGSFEINMPATFADGVYNGVVAVHNSSTGLKSTGTIFTLVIPEPPKISPITGSGSLAVGSTTTLFTATGSSSGVWTSNAPAKATVNPVNGQVTGIAVGSVIITYSLTNEKGCSNSANFNLLVVAPGTQQSLTFPAIPEKTYGDDDFTPTVFSPTTGEVFVFSSSDPKIAAISTSGQIRIIGAGTVQITASQASNTSITATQTLKVNPKTLIIKAKDQSRIYGLVNPELTVEYTGFVKGDTDAALLTKASVSTSATLTSPPGNYPITASAASAANYTISYQPGVLQISKADQILTFDPIPNKTESEPDFTLIASSSSGLPISFISSDVSIAEIVNSNQVNIIKPGTVKIEAIQNGDANYNPARISREFTIFPEFFSVGSNSFTPNGDGINDLWVLPGLESDRTATVQVYNRFGQLVFSSYGYTTPWDGNHQGSKLPQGTYFYKISVRSGKQVVSGVVTLIY